MLKNILKICKFTLFDVPKQNIELENIITESEGIFSRRQRARKRVELNMRARERREKHLRDAFPQHSTHNNAHTLTPSQTPPR